MFRLSRLLAPLTVAAAFAAVVPAAHADSFTFPGAGTGHGVSVDITDPVRSSPTVHLTVTVENVQDLDDTYVFLGRTDYDIPETVIGVDGVRSARYRGEAEDVGTAELSTATCAIYDSTLIYDTAHGTPSATTFTAELPKGQFIGADSIGVTAGIRGAAPDCTNVDGDHNGLPINYLASRHVFAGLDWEAAATPVITAIDGGRRQIALSFDQEPDTTYDIYRLVNGQAEPFLTDIDGHGDDTQVVITQDDDGDPLAPSTEYSFQVQAVRSFSGGTGHHGTGSQEGDLLSDFSATATATTRRVQAIQFTSTPPASTTARAARFTWSISANDEGDAPGCLLDPSENSGNEIPCTTTGVSLDGLSVGTHRFIVYTADDYATYTWTVTDVTAAPALPVVPAKPAPKNTSDLDGDGIKNTWLVNGKPAPAPATPKASVSGGKVKLKLAAAPKGAKKVRVYRADGKGKYKLVTTLAPKSKTFTDKKVKPGHTYKYKAVGVNAKGQQGKASKTATARITKKK